MSQSPWHKLSNAVEFWREARGEKKFKWCGFGNGQARALRHVHRPILRRVRELERLKKTSQSQVKHLERERRAGAGPPAGAEGHELELLPPGVDVGVAREEPLRLEGLRVRPHPRVALDLPDVDNQARAGRDVVARHDAVLEGLPGAQKRAGRVEAEGLFDDGLEVGKVFDVWVLDLAISAYLDV